ncbi:oxygen-independent coproporphyrinogen-3 oxidase [Pseudorhodobacter antarcticus]|uniref:Heme chaperone HemW n=2 Tax=Pseudorhodobacter antarcticus TaxID=1077947 RepID=A0A1H8C0F4_9RHOB|nr:oxygen-independent coproporphyrinogen-3 oxidase [Pseudorhodobacter antarcticus]
METKGRLLQSVFFGGGTPSLMSPDLVHKVIEKIRNTWTLANDIEITMEANPSSVEAGRFRSYRDAGVNRVSVGVQALNDADLKALGRLHSVAEARKAVDVAHANFDRVSFDLIYARQSQTLANWRVELKEALEMAGSHLSLYQLTIEEGTAFGDRFKRGLLRGLPNEDLGADMYIATQEMTAAAGFDSYEVSNYAKSSQISQHNCIYWDAGDYIGIGPGAHGRLTLNGTRYGSEAISNPYAWLNAIKTGTLPERRNIISRSDQGVEYLMMGLRRDNGIDLNRYYGLTGSRIDEEKLLHLEAIAITARKNNRLFVTQKGRMVLNSVIDTLMDP